MHKIKGALAGFAGLVIMLILIEVMVPNTQGLTIGILQLICIPFKAFFMKDGILTAVLFIVFAISLYGSVSLSRRIENKLWGIASGIVSIISFVGMVTQCSGGE